jgi:hypothetical protein
MLAENLEDKMKRLFPQMERWTPTKDKLARQRKTLASQNKLTRPPTVGKKKQNQTDQTRLSPRVTPLPLLLTEDINLFER